MSAQNISMHTPIHPWCSHTDLPTEWGTGASRRRSKGRGGGGLRRGGASNGSVEEGRGLRRLRREASKGGGLEGGLEGGLQGLRSPFVGLKVCEAPFVTPSSG